MYRDLKSPVFGESTERDCYLMEIEFNNKDHLCGAQSKQQERIPNLNSMNP